MILYGFVYKVDEKKTGISKKGRPWTKQRLIVELDGSKQNRIPVDFWGDDAEIAEGMSEGTNIQFSFELKGNEWKDRYYVEIAGSSLKELGKRPTATAQASNHGQHILPIEDNEDDLPF